MADTKFHIYIIQSKEGYRYTGFTEDIEHRLEQHNNKELSIWTRRGSEWKIIYLESYDTKSEALSREKWLKTGAGRDFIKSVLR